MHAGNQSASKKETLDFKRCVILCKKSVFHNSNLSFHFMLSCMFFSAVWSIFPLEKCHHGFESNKQMHWQWHFVLIVTVHQVNLLRFFIECLNILQSQSPHTTHLNFIFLQSCFWTTCTLMTIQQSAITHHAFFTHWTPDFLHFENEGRCGVCGLWLILHKLFVLAMQLMNACPLGPRRNEKPKGISIPLWIYMRL